MAPLTVIPGRALTAAEASARYRARNPERKKATDRRYRALNADKAINATRQWRYANPVKKLLQIARARARQRHMHFDITEADLLPLPTQCPILGIELNYATSERNGRKNWNAASLDRRDNTKGYIRGNVFIVSLRANMLKSDGTAHEHKRIAIWMGE